MIVYKAKIVNGEYVTDRSFYEFSNALKWLYSFAYGLRSINGTEYTRAQIKENI